MDLTRPPRQAPGGDAGNAVLLLEDQGYAPVAYRVLRRPSMSAVAAGSVVSQYVDPRYLSYIAGAGFIIIGIWTIVQAA